MESIPKMLMSVDWTQVNIQNTVVQRMLNGYYVLTDTYEHYRAAIEKVVEVARAKQIPHPFLRIHPSTPKGVFQAIKDAKKVAIGRKAKEKPANEPMHT